MYTVLAVPRACVMTNTGVHHAPVVSVQYNIKEEKKLILATQSRASITIVLADA